MNQNNISYSEVIEGLKCCSVQENRCDKCPIGLGWGCAFKLKKQALVLLKEREPVKPLIANDMYFCGSCKYAIPRTTNYCPKCGKKVEWDA